VGVGVGDIADDGKRVMDFALYGPIIGVGAALALALIGARLAMAAGLLPDRPNHRSSHSKVTSRAGGLVIFGAWLAAMMVVIALAPRTEMTTAALKLGGLAALAMLAGLADDKWDMPPALKFIGQFGVAALYSWSFGPLLAAPLPFIGETPLAPPIGHAITVFWVVAFMNAFNFMDGINGIAGGCAAIGLAAFAIVAGFAGAPLAAIAAALLAVSCFGFLPANLGRGRLFMGDCGSQSVSFLIAALGVYAANASEGRASALLVPVIFLPFIFDVVWTLAHRIVRRQNILRAHREHLYQLRLRLGSSHGRVALGYMAMTGFSAAAAILMLTLPAERQAFALLLLVSLLMTSAAFTMNAALKAGLLKAGAAKGADIAVQTAE